MNEKIRIAITDDHPLFREGVAAIISNENDMEIVGQGSCADDAFQMARDLLPDAILLDIDMPGNGLEAAQKIAVNFPVIKIIVLTVSENEDNLMRAIRLGARAYILKGVAGRELIRIVRSVLAGESYVPSQLAASLLSEMSKPMGRAQDPEEGMDDLTDREHDILELLATGLSNKEIGEKLFLTEKTVKHYMTNILQKLQVHNRVEAALLAQKNAWGEKKTAL